MMMNGRNILFSRPGIVPLLRRNVALRALLTAFSGVIITVRPRASLRRLSLRGISGVSTAPKYAFVTLTPVFWHSILSSRY